MDTSSSAAHLLTYYELPGHSYSLGQPAKPGLGVVLHKGVHEIIHCMYRPRPFISSLATQQNS